MIVVKLGGSLFEQGSLPERVSALRTTIGEPIVMIPGGGRLADTIRNWDRIHALQTRSSHELAIRTLSVSAHFLAHICESLTLADTFEGARWLYAGGKSVVLDVAPELLATDDLPAGWDVTSDSIAGWVARRLSANKLILVKSTSLPSPEPSLEAAAQAGLVDEYFPHADWGHCELCWCQLTPGPLAVQPWRSSP